MILPQGIAWSAPAKINLFLHVLGRREDGYHLLQTAFQLLDWGDDVYVQAQAQPQIVRNYANYDVTEQEDLAVRAASLLQSHSRVSSGALLGVHKRIPMGSGMGGGSSNAATVLLVLNRLWNCGLNLSELAELGASLGADVPLFIHGFSALGTGVGEQLEPMSFGAPAYVLVFPEFSVSTAEVFSDPQLKRDSLPLSRQQVAANLGRNDCQAVVCRRFPGFQQLLKSLCKWGDARMTGTGSGIFIPMPEISAAKRAAQELKNLYNVRAVSGVAQSALHQQLEAEDI